MFQSVKGSSGITTPIPEPAYPSTLSSDVAFKRSKTTIILSDNNISHFLSRNVSVSVSITSQSEKGNLEE